MSSKSSESDLQSSKDAEQPDPKSDTNSSGGEDESSTERNGDDSHLHEDQKSRRLDA